MSKTAIIAKITDAYVRYYYDNQSYKAYVEWIDEHGRAGRTQGDAVHNPPWEPVGEHMIALFARAKREGIEPRREHW